MSNRSYLYIHDRESGRIAGLSEWAYDIPLSHLILASAEPELVPSRIFDCAEPLAIRAGFREGRRRLLGFLRTLQQNELLSPDEAGRCFTEAFCFLSQWEEFQQPEILLEPAEVFAMEYEDVAGACRLLREEALLHIGDYVRDRLEQFRKMKAAGREEDIRDTLGLEWDTVLFYDLGD